MKRKFSSSWKSSKQPRKQRKYLANAMLHIKKKMVSSNLSKELRKKYKKRSLPVRKGDIVKIFRGKFKGKKGKIVNVNLKIKKIEMEGIQVKKQDGSKVNVKLEPSNLQILELNLEDRKRNIIFIKDEKNQNKKIGNKEVNNNAP
ncbi:MAG: 50S ribosomal protein L24 [Nanoarchaeota archaeon]